MVWKWFVRDLRPKFKHLPNDAEVNIALHYLIKKYKLALIVS